MLSHILWSPTAGATVTVTPTPTEFFEIVASASGTTGGSIVVVASGGTAPYTYLWTESLSNFTINGATTDTVDFNYSGLNLFGDSITGIITCTVTDFYGNSGYVIIGIEIVRG